jgi:hypothetical protein
MVGFRGGVQAPKPVLERLPSKHVRRSVGRDYTAVDTMVQRTGLAARRRYGEVEVNSIYRRRMLREDKYFHERQILAIYKDHSVGKLIFERLKYD